jgi:hypothetical protein
MRQDSAQASLSDEILLLHPHIMKVYVLQETAGRLHVVEKAARYGFDGDSDEVDQSLESGSLNPGLVLGDAADLNLGTPRLVGAIYDEELLVFARISSYRVLVVRAQASKVHEVLQSLNTSLPRLVDGLGMGSRSVNRAKSAAEITEIARTYVSSVVRSPDVVIDAVAFDHGARIWDIQGSYRTFPLSRSKRFSLQLGAQKGEVIGFTSMPRSSLAPLLVGTCMIIGMLFFLAWLLILNH